MLDPRIVAQAGQLLRQAQQGRTEVSARFQASLHGSDRLIQLGFRHALGGQGAAQLHAQLLQQAVDGGRGLAHGVVEQVDVEIDRAQARDGNGQRIADEGADVAHGTGGRLQVAEEGIRTDAGRHQVHHDGRAAAGRIEIVADRAGKERVDIARNGHHVADGIAFQVRHQVLALAVVAVPLVAIEQEAREERRQRRLLAGGGDKARGGALGLHVGLDPAKGDHLRGGRRRGAVVGSHRDAGLGRVQTGAHGSGALRAGVGGRAGNRHGRRLRHGLRCASRRGGHDGACQRHAAAHQRQGAGDGLAHVGHGAQGQQRGDRIRAIQAHAQQGHFIAPQLPRRGGRLHLALPPVALCAAQHADGSQRVGAGFCGGRHFLAFHAVEQRLRHQVAAADAAQRLARGRIDGRFGNRMVGAVQALVRHHQLHQFAELEIAVDLDVLERCRAGIKRDVGRHVFEPRLVGAAAAGRLVQVAAIRRHDAFVGGGVLPGVVREFVIIPDGDEGKALVHGLQARIGAVFLVQVAVIGHGGGVFRAGGAVLERAIGQLQLVVAAFHGAALEGFAHRFIDVIAQVDDEIERFIGGDVRQRAPVIDAPVLARQVGELQLRHVAACCRRRLEAAHVGAHVAGDELVKIHLARLQARHLVAQGIVEIGFQRQFRIDDGRAGQGCVAAQGGRIVGRTDDQTHGHVRLAGHGRRNGVETGGHDARPQHGAVGARISRSHALRKFPVAARGQRHARIAVIGAAAGGEADSGHGDGNKTAQFQKLPPVHLTCHDVAPSIW